MSNTNTNGSLTHYNHQHIQVRKDFFDLCSYNKEHFNQTLTKSGKKAKNAPNQECMAKILRLFETLTDSKRKEYAIKMEKYKAKKIKPPTEPTTYFLELTYTAISHLLYDTHSESTIRKSINTLLEREYITRSQESKNSIPRYVLNVAVVQKALNEQAIKSVPASDQEAEGIHVPAQENEVSTVPAEPVKLQAEVSTLQPEGVKLQAEVSKLTANNIYPNNALKKEDKKEQPDVVQEQKPTQQPNVSLSPSSQKKETETKTETTQEINYELFDQLLQEQTKLPDIKQPRTPQNNEAITTLQLCKATPEQVTFVFNSIWNDPDDFWQQHRGKIATVASQFVARVSGQRKKTETTPRYTNWTENKNLGTQFAYEYATTKPTRADAQAQTTNVSTQMVTATTATPQPQTASYTRLKAEGLKPSEVFARALAERKNRTDTAETRTLQRV